jgi:hypothetical protein
MKYKMAMIKDDDFKTLDLWKIHIITKRLQPVVDSTIENIIFQASMTDKKPEKLPFSERVALWKIPRDKPLWPILLSDTPASLMQ